MTHKLLFDRAVIGLLAHYILTISCERPSVMSEMAKFIMCQLAARGTYYQHPVLYSLTNYRYRQSEKICE